MIDLINEYSEFANLVHIKLCENMEWIQQYKNYANILLSQKEKYMDARKLFRRSNSLYYYLTIGKIQKGILAFDVRYLGQSVGTINVEKEKVYLSVSESQASNSKKWFGYELGVIDKIKWKDAKDFRKFYQEDIEGCPRQREHMVESALFSEFEKKSSVNKTLKHIQPIEYAGTRIHMKTAVSASKAGKKDVVAVSNVGGEIDCLCRRNDSAFSSRLAAIEIKDENKNSESFDKAMKQAISYAVFLRDLIRSDAGEAWKEIWQMQNQYKNQIIIDAVVAMPQGTTKPSYAGEKIYLDCEGGSQDCIELHYIEITSVINANSSEDVNFNSSYL